MSTQPIVLDQSWQIESARLLSIKHALRFHLLGMTRPGLVKAARAALEDHGVKPARTAAALLDQVVTLLDDQSHPGMAPGPWQEKFRH